uniref:Uncharacterized protein n=1 Tax=Ditylenchus dipsaci TaxID=166011 RepID=A0A915DAN8_9BILA
MIIQVGMLFSGMLVGYFFRPEFVDDFCVEDLAESSMTNAMLIQPLDQQLGTPRLCLKPFVSKAVCV